MHEIRTCSLILNIETGWLIGCRFKAKSSLVGLGTIGGMSSIGAFLKDPNPYLSEFRKKKNRKNSERLSQQARPGIGPGTFRLSTPAPPLVEYRETEAECTNCSATDTPLK